MFPQAASGQYLSAQCAINCCNLQSTLQSGNGTHATEGLSSINLSTHADG